MRSRDVYSVSNRSQKSQKFYWSEAWRSTIEGDARKEKTQFRDNYRITILGVSAGCQKEFWTQWRKSKEWSFPATWTHQRHMLGDPHEATWLEASMWIMVTTSSWRKQRLYSLIWRRRQTPRSSSGLVFNKKQLEQFQTIFSSQCPPLISPS